MRLSARDCCPSCRRRRRRLCGCGSWHLLQHLLPGTATAWSCLLSQLLLGCGSGSCCCGHLLYEQQSNITTLKADAELALKLQHDEFAKREAEAQARPR